MKAMILAAGYGTRLRPLTYSVPKPMVPVCNRPLIGYTVENLLAAGVDEIIVNLHHLPEAIEQHLTTEYGDRCKLHFSFEREILGTGGGIRKVRALLENEDEFFLVNGDTIQFPLFGELRNARRRRDALAALTLRHPPEGDRFTPVWLKDGLITGFGKGEGEALMFSGSHLISSRIFQYLPEKDFSGIVDEVYMPALAQKRETIAAVLDDGPWFDIGTPERYISAARGVLEMTIAGKVPLARNSKIVRGSILDQSATVNGTLSSSAVGPRTYLEGEVKDSVIGADCRIRSSAILESCIVGDGVEITRPLELRKAMICRESDSIPRDSAYRYEDGLVIASF